MISKVSPQHDFRGREQAKFYVGITIRDIMRSYPTLCGAAITRIDW